MDNFQVILIVLGVVYVTGLYVWEKIKSPRTKVKKDYS